MRVNDYYCSCHGSEYLVKSLHLPQNAYAWLPIPQKQSKNDRPARSDGNSRWLWLGGGFIISVEYQTEESWSKAYLVDESFLQLASMKKTVLRADKTVTVYKYYHQALMLTKPIVIAKSAKSAPEYVVNLSDLWPDTIAELKTKDDAQSILKLAVGKYFSNISHSGYTTLA